jgi:threonine dehydrogenase-like Zn-dependent dehydrogenase
MTEFVVDDERYMHVVRRALRDVAVLVEPLTIAEKGLMQVDHEATGTSGLAFQAMKVLGTNGIFVFTGVPGRKAAIEVDTDVVMRDLVLKNQVVFGTVNAGPEAFEAAIHDLTLFRQRWPAAVDALITGRHRVEAHRDLLVGPARGIKNVLTFA